MAEDTKKQQQLETASESSESIREFEIKHNSLTADGAYKADGPDVESDIRRKSSDN